jgi:hypothetical protein
MIGQGGGREAQGVADQKKEIYVYRVRQKTRNFSFFRRKFSEISAIWFILEQICSIQ